MVVSSPAMTSRFSCLSVLPSVADVGSAGAGQPVLVDPVGLMVTSAESLTLLLDTGARREIE